MKKEHVRIGSTVIFSLIFGFAFIWANSWFFQHPVEWGVPQSTYLIVMIALFFIDTIAFIFMQLYFIYNRQEFSNCILSLAFLSCLIYFVQTVITVQQPVDSHADISIITNDVAIYYLFRQINLCLLIVLALICKIFENRKQRANRLKKTMLIISLTCLFIVPFVSHVVSSHHEILSLDLVEYVSAYKKIDLDTIHITVIIVMWLALLLANLYYNRFRYDIWNGVSVIAFSAVLYNMAILFSNGNSAFVWYVSRSVEIFSKLTVMSIFMCHIFHALRVTKDIAHRDPLTNIFNRSYFFNELKGQVNSGDNKPFCVMIMDIDHFKSVNDTWGHPEGDKVIKAVVDIIGKSIRPDDVLARVGGEEFGVMLTHLERKEGEELAERIRKNVEQLTDNNPQYAIAQKVTISIGVVVTQGDVLHPSDIYRLADNALYNAKATGRNKVIVTDGRLPDAYA